MNDEAAFLAAIAADPKDNNLKLVFADWLEERGDPRAAWLRDPVLLPWMGPTLQSPIPALIEALTKDRRVIDVRRACERIGEPVVAPLAKLRKHDSSRVRQQAALCLRKIGKRAQAAVPALLKALKDPADHVREQVAKTLKVIGLPADIGTDTLRDALGDENYIVRQVASKLLGTMRAKEGVALDLAKRLDSPEPQQRKAATAVLAALDSAQAVAPLERMLDDPLPEVRAAAAEALGQLRKHKAAIGPLCRALRDNNRAVREAAARQFGQYDFHPPPEALGALRAALADSSAVVRTEVGNALSRCGEWAAEAIPDLLKNLSHRNASVRFAAVAALREVGRDDPRVLDALLKALEDPSDGVASWAVEGLGQWSQLPNEVAEPLFRYIRRARMPTSPDSPMYPEQAYAALAKLENPTPEVIAELRRAVAETPESAWWTCQALGAIGPGAAAAIPELVDTIRRGEAVPGAMQALVQMGGPGIQRLAGLIAAGDCRQAILGHSNLWHLLQALQELAAAGRGDEILPLLRAMRQRLRKATEPWEQEQLLTALKSVGTADADAIADLLTVAEAPIIPEDRVRPAALEALAEFGPALVPHFTRILALSRRPEFPSFALWPLARILVRLVPHVPAAMDRLRELLRETAPVKGEAWDREIGRTTFRTCAAWELAALGPAAAPAIPELAKLLKASDAHVRSEAVKALGQTKDPAAVPHLRRAAGETDGLVRSAAVKALGYVGDTSDESVAAIAASLQHDNVYIRREAVAALIQLSPATAAVRDALELVTKDTDRTVRTRAAAALKRIQGRKKKSR